MYSFNREYIENLFSNANTTFFFHLQRMLDQVSPVPLSRHHKERESSKLNLSFGLDASSFSDHFDLDDDNSVNSEAGTGQDIIKNVYKSVSSNSYRTEKHDLRYALNFVNPYQIVVVIYNISRLIWYAL